MQGTRANFLIRTERFVHKMGVRLMNKNHVGMVCANMWGHPCRIKKAPCLYYCSYIPACDVAVYLLNRHATKGVKTVPEFINLFHAQLS